MTLDEEQKVLAVAAVHLRDLVIAGLDTGMRRGELLSQQWADVDLSRKVLAVTRSKTPQGEAREIPLTKRLYELLSGRAKQSGLVFTYDGQPTYSVKRAWKTALKKAKVRPIRFHESAPYV